MCCVYPLKCELKTIYSSKVGVIVSIFSESFGSIMCIF